MRTDIEATHPDGVSEKLDAYVPPGAGPFPIAILVHGGGWSSGEEAAGISGDVQALAEANFTWFSIDYRMGPVSKWPACYVSDMKSAIVWVKRARAAEYKGDPNRIALIGYSAGGELVTLAAVQGDESTRVQAVVGFAPPTDMVTDTKRRGGLSTSLKNLFGTTSVEEAQARLHEMSAIDYLKPGLPPFLLIQGNADKSVPYEQTQAFGAKLKEVGVPVEFITRLIRGRMMCWRWEKIDPDYRGKVVAWLEKALGR